MVSAAVYVPVPRVLCDATTAQIVHLETVRERVSLAIAAYLYQISTSRRAIACVSNVHALLHAETKQFRHSVGIAVATAFLLVPAWRAALPSPARRCLVKARKPMAAAR